MSPTLACEFLTTGPQGKSKYYLLIERKLLGCSVENRLQGARAEAGGPVRRPRWARILWLGPEWEQVFRNKSPEEPVLGHLPFKVWKKIRGQQIPTSFFFFSFFLGLFFPLPCSRACRLLVPQPGIETGFLAVKAQVLASVQPGNSLNPNVLRTVLKDTVCKWQTQKWWDFPASPVVKTLFYCRDTDLNLVGKTRCCRKR